MQTIKTETTEIHDPYGHYGEDKVAHGTLELLSDGKAFKVQSVLPDHRVIVEYEGNEKEAQVIFSMIAKSRVPEMLR